MESQDVQIQNYFTQSSIIFLTLAGVTFQHNKFNGVFY